MAEAVAVKDKNFKEMVLNSSVPVLVDFWAPWCAPCQAINPILDELAQKYNGKIAIYKMNVDENRVIPAQLGVRGLPAVFVFKNGKVMGNIVGTPNRAKILSLVEKAI